MNRSGLLRAIFAQYVLEPEGIHGLAHWARVCAAGQRLAEFEGVDPDFVELFALLHDACRWDDGHDPEHGARAAELAATLRGEHFELPDADFDALTRALTLHSDGLLDELPAVQVCWDADRLDLPRVGVRPRPERLCTAGARALLASRDEYPAEDAVLARWRVNADGRLLTINGRDDA
jgi:uncharacterized protein